MRLSWLSHSIQTVRSSNSRLAIALTKGSSHCASPRPGASTPTRFARCSTRWSAEFGNLSQKVSPSTTPVTTASCGVYSSAFTAGMHTCHRRRRSAQREDSTPATAYLRRRMRSAIASATITSAITTISIQPIKGILSADQS